MPVQKQMNQLMWLYTEELAEHSGSVFVSLVTPVHDRVITV